MASVAAGLAAYFLAYYLAGGVGQGLAAEGPGRGICSVVAERESQVASASWFSSEGVVGRINSSLVRSCAAVALCLKSMDCRIANRTFDQCCFVCTPGLPFFACVSFAKAADHAIVRTLL